MSYEDRPLVFALCGLDGVGKTSIFSELFHIFGGSDYAFVGRGPSDAETEVEQLFPRKWNNRRDWLEGDFASAMAFACAVDYSAYYRATIGGLINGTCSKLFGLKVKAIITDRHALCFQAYAHCVSPPSYLTLKLLEQIPEPDVIFYIELSEEEVSRRRREKGDEFDDPQIQAAEKKGYQDALNNYHSILVRVDNSGCLNDTVKFITQEIDKRMCSNEEN